MIGNLEFDVCLTNNARHLQNCDCLHWDRIWRATMESMPTVLPKMCATFQNKTFIKPMNIKGKVKVKVTLVQALRLCTGRTAHRGSRGIALPFHDHGTRRGWGVSVTPRPLFTPWKQPVPTVQEAWWAPGPVWTGAALFVAHRDSIPGPSSS